jgi:hypothetical protein
MTLKIARSAFTSTVASVFVYVGSGISFNLLVFSTTWIMCFVLAFVLYEMLGESKGDNDVQGKA